MIRNYLTSNIRALWKNRTHTIINMLGLALGITCSILIFLIMRFERSYDNYHPDSERIYRVVTEFNNSEKPGYSSGLTYPLPPALRKDFEDPEYVSIVDCNMEAPVITILRENGSTEKFKEPKAAFVDPGYFKIFSYEWVAGNSDALLREKTVVITESIAKKYFGNTPALYKVINYNNEFDVTVSGVIKDPPLNTDFPFNMIFSMRLGANKRGWDAWDSSSDPINCYVKLRPGVSSADFNAKLKDWHLKYFTGDKEKDGKMRRYYLQPLSEMHFDTRFNNYNRIVSPLTLFTLASIGVLLLLTACINFINLNTVLIINRSKEAGIRKVMGSSRMQLVLQFLGETLAITLLSLLVSAGLVELALINLTPVLKYRLSFHPFTDPVTLLFLLLLPIVVTLLAGMYPGISLSRFQPAQALKNKLSGKPGQGFNLRRGLIVFQLMISQSLVIATIIVVQQLDHFTSQPLGITTDAVVEFALPQNKSEMIHRLSDRLQQIHGVEYVAMSNSGSIAGNSWSGGFIATVNGKQIEPYAQVKFVSSDFIKTYQIDLLTGNNLLPSDTVNGFLVNETTVKALGLENIHDAIGVPLNVWDNMGVITGVVRDFNTNPLHSKIGCVVLLSGVRGYYIGAVRLNTQHGKQTLSEIQKAWEDIYPSYVFEYKFLDDKIPQFYEEERRSGYLIGIFAGVAIFIGCIGLFGLISFIAKSKTKEIGIRKTLGASVGQVVALFSKEFIVLIAISFVLSSPLVYYFMEQWLKNFAYRIYPGIPTFLIGITLTFIVVLGTIGIKSYRAAIANPVDALRDE